jgi:hypothetical protein
LDRPAHRQDIGRKLIGRGTVRRLRLHRRVGGLRPPAMLGRVTVIGPS